MKNPSDAQSQRMLVLARFAPGDGRNLKWLVTRRRQLPGLSGTLLFDGERVAELLMGRAEVLDAAWADLCADPMFSVRIRMLRDPHPQPQIHLPPVWRYGYCEIADLDAVFARAPTGLALDSLACVAGRVDLSP